MSLPSTLDGIQLTIEPVSAAGTGTIAVNPTGAQGFETVLDGAGTALDSVPLSAQKSYFLKGAFSTVRVTSSNPADTFNLVVNA